MASTSSRVAAPSPLFVNQRSKAVTARRYDISEAGRTAACCKGVSPRKLCAAAGFAGALEANGEWGTIAVAADRFGFGPRFIG